MPIKIPKSKSQHQTGKGPRQYAKSDKVISTDSDAPCTTGASKDIKTTVLGKVCKPGDKNCEPKAKGGRK